MNFVLDRWDMDSRYIGDCPVCSQGIYDEDETAVLCRETVHKACYDEVNEEVSALEMDWRQSE